MKDLFSREKGKNIYLFCTNITCTFAWKYLHERWMIVILWPRLHVNVSRMRFFQINFVNNFFLKGSLIFLEITSHGDLKGPEDKWSRGPADNLLWRPWRFFIEIHLETYLKTWRLFIEIQSWDMKIFYNDIFLRYKEKLFFIENLKDGDTIHRLI